MPKMEDKTNYSCKICGHNNKQKSHHITHINTDKHKQQVEILKLKLEKVTKEELKEKYNDTNINNIIKSLETYKTLSNKKINKINNMKDNENIEQDIEFDKIYENKEIWNEVNCPDENSEYDKHYEELDNIIKKCHQILYSECSIVGVKAMNDISKILIIKLLEKDFNNPNTDLALKLKDLIENNSSFEKHVKYLLDIKTLVNEEGNQINKWKIMTEKILSIVLDGIYSKDDSTFNFKDNNVLIQLIEVICKLEITDGFLDAFSATSGDIHEAFCKYGGKTTSKELGQFFTPRKLINLLFHGFKLKDMCSHMVNPSIFDPCMGTAGFLNRIYTLLNIKPENIYGCETEPDTIKFAFSSIHLTTGETKSILTKCNSLCHNPYLPTKKHNLIVSNPPFGTSNNYDKLKKKYEEKFGETSDVKFEDIYPLKTNNGACLFTQMCVFKLEKDGICVIVLPDGELFEGNSKWSKTFRKWLCETVNIQTILKVPSGTFEHAGVSTNVVIFKNNGPTKNIKFYTTNKECSIIKTLFDVNMKELKQTHFNLDVERYLKPEDLGYTVPMVKLKSIIEYIPKSKRSAKEGKKEGSYNFYTSSKKIKKSNYNDYKEECLIIGTGGTANIKIDTMFSCSADNFIIKSKMNKYIYYYLDFNIWILEKGFRGSGLKHISKEYLNNIKIPLPSLEIQQEIVEELTQLEESIKSVETRISQLKREKEQYKKYAKKAEIRSILKDSPFKKLADICEIHNGTRIVKKSNKEGIYPVYGSGDQTFTTNKFNREKFTIIISRFALSINCVRLLNKKLFLNDSGISINHSDPIYKKFIGYYLLFNQYIIYNLSRGAAQRNLNMDKFKLLKIPVPSLEIQQECIKIYEEKEARINFIQAKIDAELKYLNELKELGKDIISSFCNSSCEKVKEYTIDGEIYIKQNVRGDGHCFFKAVSFYTDYDIKELRNMTADYIKDNIDEYKETYLPEDHEGLSLEDYIEKIRNTNEWADNDSIIALQKALNRSIKIYNEDGSIRIGSDIESSEEPINIIYNGINHYDAIIKK